MPKDNKALVALGLLGLGAWYAMKRREPYVRGLEVIQATRADGYPLRATLDTSIFEQEIPEDAPLLENYARPGYLYETKEGDTLKLISRRAYGLMQSDAQAVANGRRINDAPFNRIYARYVDVSGTLENLYGPQMLDLGMPYQLILIPE